MQFLKTLCLLLEENVLIELYFILQDFFVQNLHFQMHFSKQITIVPKKKNQVCYVNFHVRHLLCIANCFEKNYYTSEQPKENPLDLDFHTMKKILDFCLDYSCQLKTLITASMKSYVCKKSIRGWLYFYASLAQKKLIILTMNTKIYFYLEMVF